MPALRMIANRGISSNTVGNILFVMEECHEEFSPPEAVARKGVGRQQRDVSEMTVVTEATRQAVPAWADKIGIRRTASLYESNVASVASTSRCCRRVLSAAYMDSRKSSRTGKEEKPEGQPGEYIPARPAGIALSGGIAARGFAVGRSSRFLLGFEQLLQVRHGDQREGEGKQNRHRRRIS